MNSPHIARLSSVLAGLTLTLLLAGWIVPFIQFSAASQFDFWSVWLLCMLILALPLSLLECPQGRASSVAAGSGDEYSDLKTLNCYYLYSNLRRFLLGRCRFYL